MIQFVCGESAEAVCGYYTLSSYGIEPAALPPEVAKKLPRYPLLPATMLGRLVAGVEDDHIGRRAAIAGRHRPIKETNDIVLARCVDCDRFGAAACRANRFDDLRKLLGRSAGDQHMICLRAEAAAQRGTKPALGAHTHNDRSAAALARAHVNVPVAGHFNLMTTRPTSSNDGRRTGSASGQEAMHVAVRKGSRAWPAESSGNHGRELTSARTLGTFT
jgi:hypothetical protein